METYSSSGNKSQRPPQIDLTSTHIRRAADSLRGRACREGISTNSARRLLDMAALIETVADHIAPLERHGTEAHDAA